MNFKTRVQHYFRRMGQSAHPSRLMRHGRNYPLLGGMLALAGPSGLLLSQSVAEGVRPTIPWMLTQIADQPLTYGYLTIASQGILVGLGYLLGRKSDHLRALSHTDPLTGLFNRRLFNERLEMEMERSTRYDAPLSLMALDLDRLKVINDRGGHKAGDLALLAVATSLLKSVRSIDIAARIGGDEFVVLLPQTTAAEAEKQANRFQKNFTNLEGRSPDPLSVSVGIAQFDPTIAGRARGEHFLLAADIALYQAKELGGDQTIVAKSNTETPQQSLESARHPTAFKIMKPNLHDK